MSARGCRHGGGWIGAQQTLALNTKVALWESCGPFHYRGCTNPCRRYRKPSLYAMPVIESSGRGAVDPFRTFFTPSASTTSRACRRRTWTPSYPPADHEGSRVPPKPLCVSLAKLEGTRHFTFGPSAYDSCGVLFTASAGASRVVRAIRA